ncbi:MAG: 50S ribosomal protein L34e [Candidatus Diapherotrites archaeon CG10_big_fil_rev_8_21_14_0_10_31_34]|nr:MAG: 50S ribosomal protein L34e [Candidatus Diapherotrites archaeon CG10_big_fil_rev_8_21_14_0_10_31_34]
MTQPKDKNKKKKFRKSIKGKSKAYYTKEKKAKHACALCKNVLHGTPHSKSIGKISKLSKTQKRPSVAFGGMLCSKCRTQITDEAIKIISKEKKEQDLELKTKNYVKQMIEMIK